MKKLFAASILVLVYGGLVVGTFVHWGPEKAALYWAALLVLMVTVGSVLCWAFYTLGAK